jgi:hypothetical protein
LAIYPHVAVGLAQLFIEGRDRADVINRTALLHEHPVGRGLQAEVARAHARKGFVLREDVQLTHQKKTMGGDEDLDAVPAEMEDGPRGLLDQLRIQVGLGHIPEEEALVEE